MPERNRILNWMGKRLMVVIFANSWSLLVYTIVVLFLFQFYLTFEINIMISLFVVEFFFLI